MAKNNGGKKKSPSGFTKDELHAMADEINTVCELDEDDQIILSQTLEELEGELKSAVTGSDPEIELMIDDGFTNPTWDLLERLGCETAKKRKALQETAEEEGDDTAEEVGNETGEDDDEAEEIEITQEFVNSTKKLSDLKSLVKEHAEFGTLRNSVDQYKGSKGLTQLKQDMVNLLKGDSGTDSKAVEPTEKPKGDKKPEKPEKQEPKKTEKKPSKGGSFGAKKFTATGKSTMETLADLVAEGRYTKKSFVEKAVELGVSESCAKTYLSHGKKETNIKRLKLTNIIEISDDGIVKLKGNEKKKNSSSNKKKK